MLRLEIDVRKDDLREDCLLAHPDFKVVNFLMKPRNTCYWYTAQYIFMILCRNGVFKLSISNTASKMNA